MTTASITIRTDARFKKSLAKKAKRSGLTLSGYLNQKLRQIVQDDDELDYHISPERWAKEVAIAEQRLNNPNAKWVDARQAIIDLGKKYGV